MYFGLKSSALSPLGALLPFLGAVCCGEVRVSPVVYDTVRLPCWFPFIQGVDNLIAVWEKAGKGGNNLQVYKFANGQNDLSNQDSQFRGRTDLSGDISQGKLDLTLTGVTMIDDGVYYCRAANIINHGDNSVILSVSALPPQMIESLVDGDVALVPKYFGVPTEINWKLDSSKIVEMELVSPVPHFYRLDDRAALHRNGTLTIRNLRKEDSGIYKSEVLVNNYIQETELWLTVLDRVSKPTMYDSSSSQEINLSCISSTVNVTYTWLDKARGETVSTKQEYIAPRPKENVVLTCTVNNSLSEDSESITIPDIADIGNSGKHRYIIIILILILAILLLISVFLYNHKAFRKKKKKSDKTIPLNKCIDNDDIEFQNTEEDTRDATEPKDIRPFLSHRPFIPDRLSPDSDNSSGQGFQKTEKDNTDTSEPKDIRPFLSDHYVKLVKMSPDSDNSSGQGVEKVHGPDQVLEGVGTVSVIQEPPRLTLFVGETANMSCDVRDSGKVNILQYWHMNGSGDALKDSSRMTIISNSLTILSVTHNDSGLYICQVRDGNLAQYNGTGTRLSVTERISSPNNINNYLYSLVLLVLLLVVIVGWRWAARRESQIPPAEGEDGLTCTEEKDSGDLHYSTILHLPAGGQRTGERNKKKKKWSEEVEYAPLRMETPHLPTTCDPIGTEPANVCYATLRKSSMATRTLEQSATDPNRI